MEDVTPDSLSLMVDELAIYSIQGTFFKLHEESKAAAFSFNVCKSTVDRLGAILRSFLLQ